MWWKKWYAVLWNKPYEDKKLYRIKHFCNPLFAPPAQAFSVMHFSLCAHLRSITCGVWRPSRLTLRQWTSGYVRSERCTGRSKWQHHVRSIPLYPSINAELEAGQAAITVFQVLGMTPPGIERSLRGRCKTCCTT